MTAAMESLTNEQLCAMAQAGDAEAVEALIQNNLPFIRQIAKQRAAHPIRAECFAAWGIEMDDLVQAGSFGLWKAIDSYTPAKEANFLTYAAHIVKSAMSDLIRQYSRDTVWRLRTDKKRSWRIIYLDEPLDDTGEDGEDSAYELIAAPQVKPPEPACIERETLDELHEAMEALSERESVYAQYRFGLSDNDAHSLVETARHFHLAESHAKTMEKALLDVLKNELRHEIPERAFMKAENRLTKLLVAEGELHSVELRLKSQKKRGKKITAAVYEYLADCDGEWGELNCNFRNDTVEVLALAEWDTMVSYRFAMRAMDYFKRHHRHIPPDSLVLTFISPEQRRTIVWRDHDSFYWRIWI